MGALPNGKPRRPQNPLSEVHGNPLPVPITTLRTLFAESAKKYSQNLALVSMYQPGSLFPIPALSSDGYLRWTHAQLHHAAKLLASGLKTQGVSKGQAIATFLYNSAEWNVLARASAILGCPFVPLNPRAVGNLTEVQHMLRISGAQVIVVTDVEMARRLGDGLPEVFTRMKFKFVLEKDLSALPGEWTGFYGLFENVNVKDDKVNGTLPAEEEDDAALIVFTSGTTSLPKGTIRSNKSTCAALVSNVEVLNVDKTSRTCCHMPNHHIAGFALSLSFQIAGGSTVFPSPLFEPGASLDAISQEHCTNLPCVPAILQALAAHPKMASTDTGSLRNVELGATTILPETVSLVSSVFNCAKASISYGATEAVPMTNNSVDTSNFGAISVGQVVSGCRVRICAPESRSPVERGVPGEIHMGGTSMVQGYLDGASPASFYSDDYGSWFITGDQGTMAADGTVTISGRYKDLIIRGGENIAPAAIEAVFDKLGIMAQVVGVHSEEAGEVPIAVIQSKENSTYDTGSIRTAILDTLGVAFVPEKIYDLKVLGLQDYPRTSTGKVRKVDLKALVQAHEDEQEALEELNNPGKNDNMEAKLSRIWHKIIGIDAKAVAPDTPISEFADSLTIMRFRNRIKRELVLDITIEQLLEAGTIKAQATMLASMKNSPSPVLDLNVHRPGPPGTDDIAITVGNPSVTLDIQKQVSEAIEPHGFTWEEDVEDILPSWDLGYEVFGSVAGIAKVNHRMIYSMNNASVDEVHAALRVVLKQHAMQRSFELRGLNGEPTMRVIMRANEKWLRYSIEDIPEVKDPDELVSLVQDGNYFSEVEHPYPSFLVRIAHIKSTGSAGLIWALQHSAFDGLSVYSFLEDLDSVLEAPHTPLKPHIPYKLWADMYYLHRTSLAAQRSINTQVRNLTNLSSHSKSLFPPSSTPATATVTHRNSFISAMLFASLPRTPLLKSQHGIPPFILIKAALSLFLSHSTSSPTALFSQNENGRTWPFQEPWIEAQLPQCMDLAGPTLERTVQLIPIPSSSTVLEFLRDLQTEQEDASAHVHAPWNLVRKALGGENARVFDEAAQRTCLNWLPVRTKDGVVTFRNMRYHDTKANCESWFLFNCGMEAGDKLWVQIYGDEDRVPVAVAERWARSVMNVAEWMGDRANWERQVREYEFGV